MKKMLMKPLFYGRELGTKAYPDKLVKVYKEAGVEKLRKNKRLGEF